MMAATRTPTLIERLPAVRGALTADAPLARYVWFRTGGPAEVLFQPADAEDLAAFLAAKPVDTPVTVLGTGSNLLIRDGGVDGVVIRLGRPFAQVRVDGNAVVAGGAAQDANVAKAARDAGLAGLAFLSGIPGTVGGAVKMNAGAYGTDVGDVLASATVLSGDGTLRRLNADALGFAYRHSNLPDAAVVVEAAFNGAPGDRAAIAADMARIQAAREDTQPIRTRTGGSTFKNPPDAKAWELIDAAGCRGLAMGRARVSEKHTNFLVNEGGATASRHRGPGRGGPPPGQGAVGRDAGMGDQAHRQTACRRSRAFGGNAMSKHVAVLMGGWSAEREVSLVSGAACAKALKTAGFQVTAIDVQRDMGTLMTRLYPRPDVVFNALHGRFGEDGCVQGLLDILGLPYTHSGLLASALAMDKPMAKAVFEAEGIPTAPHVIADREQVLDGDAMARPYVIKPLNEGSSVGVRVVLDGDNAMPLSETGWTYGETVMVERFIPGRELTVAVMGKGDAAKPMAVTEITTSRGFYDYDAKYADGGSIHVVPADVPGDVYDRAMDLSARAHRALGCRGVSRADLRFDGEKLFMLEVNTQPGMTPTSLVPEQAQHLGMSFEDLVTWMVDNAECDP
jgi:UDP-N-acetylenolpyruvoylglucosamine reductase